MKLLLLLLISCLVLHNGKGAKLALYKLVKCNPTGDRANCVTHQSPQMEWTPDLPTKLPAAVARNMEAEPVEDEHPPMEEEDEEMRDEEVFDEKKTPLLGDEGSASYYLPVEESSGFYEGSGSEGPFVEGEPVRTEETDTGSGDSWTEKRLNLYKVDNKKFLRWFPRRRPMADGTRPAE